jgi:hypothetical protein
VESTFSMIKSKFEKFSLITLQKFPVLWTHLNADQVLRTVLISETFSIFLQGYNSADFEGRK